MNIPFPAEALKKGAMLLTNAFKELALPKVSKVVKIGAENISKIGEIVTNSGSEIARVYSKLRNNLSRLPEPPNLTAIWNKIFPPKGEKTTKDIIPVLPEKTIGATEFQNSDGNKSKLENNGTPITSTPKEDLPNDTRLGDSKNIKSLDEVKAELKDTTKEDKSTLGEEVLLTEPGQYRNFIIEQAKTYMSLEGNQRHDLEIQVVKKLEEGNAGYEDVLLFMKSAGSIEARAWASELIWKMRQKGELKTYGLSVLSDEHIRWAEKTGVDKRILAYCIDARDAAKRLMLADPYIFYENLQTGVDEAYVENTLPNPGYMAMLLQTETGNPYSHDKWAYVYVGDGFASQEINESIDAFPNSNEYLKKLAKHHQETTGLPFLDNWESIPGSLRGDPSQNLSGGAIGPQFMPLNAVLFLNKYNTARDKMSNTDVPDLNLWDPYTGTILGYLYIASAFYARHGNLEPVNVLRPGYMKGNDEMIRAATQKWNPHAGQINQIVTAGYSYWEEFGGK